MRRGYLKNREIILYLTLGKQRFSYNFNFKAVSLKFKITERNKFI